MMVIAVLGAGIATVAFGGSVNMDTISRDVVVAGAGESEVPGRIGFRIIEDISSDEGDSMTVGVATNSATGGLDCQILDVTGGEVAVRPGSVSDSFVSANIDVDWEAVVVAEDLPAGEYSADCTIAGEPSDSSEPSGTSGNPPIFRVSRVVTIDDMFDFVRPVFGIFAAVAVGGVIGLIGLILMIVGLVIGNRARRGPPGPSVPQYRQWGQDQWGQGPSDKGPWSDR